MDKQKINSTYIGPKTKICIIGIWGYILLLTWIILSNSISLKIQAFCVLATIIVIYLTMVLLQDYFYLKTHPGTRNCRKDVRLTEPLIPEGWNNDKQT